LDYDADLRNELERDAARVVDEIGTPDAIVVTGDIAFSGQADQYDKAAQWLEHLCALLNTEPTKVWTTPGNHDVDRSVARTASIAMFHRQLRQSGPTGVDAMIADLLRDDLACEALFLPMRAYNTFAASYVCAITRDRPYWEDDLILNDGSLLRMRGITSTLVSDETDTNGDNKLVIGQMQYDLPRYDGVTYMTLCHHPPDWVIDGDNFDDRLLARAKIQLFGHKHTFRLIPIGETLRLSAGAVHPDQQEPNWIPRYSFLSLRVAGTDNARSLEVTVYPRVWDEQAKNFAPQYARSGSTGHLFELPLEPWTPALAAVQPTEPGEVAVRVPAAQDVSIDDEVSERRRIRDAERLVSYRFWRLLFHQRIAIAERLKLIRDEDKNRGEVDLFTAVLRRAASEGRFADLWDDVERERGANPPEQNLFARDKRE